MSASDSDVSAPPEREPDADALLLQRFSRGRDQAAFGEFVRRHIDLVYATALRQLSGDSHLAQDVTQLVFNDAAKKAGQLASHAVPAAWLHSATRFAAAHAVRAEQRRRRRDGESLAMQAALNPDSHDEAWSRLRPVIDRAIGELREADRDAIVLRYFEARSFTEIGRQLRLSENAARMRVDRALERLRLRLTSRGITSTSAALAGALAANSIVAAPSGLAGTVAVAAAAAAGTGGTAALLSILAAHKLSAGLTAATLLLSGAGWQYERTEQARLEQNAAVRSDAGAEAGLAARNDELRRRMADAERIQTVAADVPRLREDIAWLERQLERGPGGPVADGRPAPIPGAVDLKELDQTPKAILQVKPKFPAELLRAGIGGDALLDLVVRPDGSVSDVTVVRASHQAFGDACRDAFQGWRFQPGMKNHQAVATRLRVPVIFAVSGDNDWF